MDLLHWAKSLMTPRYTVELAFFKKIKYLISACLPAMCFSLIKVEYRMCNCMTSWAVMQHGCISEKLIMGRASRKCWCCRSLHELWEKRQTQASKEPLALDTAHLMLRKITEMDSHSAFSKRVGKYRASNLSSYLQNWFKALKKVWF